MRRALRRGLSKRKHRLPAPRSGEVRAVNQGVKDEQAAKAYFKYVALAAVVALTAGCGSSSSSSAGKATVVCKAGVKATSVDCDQADELVTIARRHGAFHGIAPLKTGSMTWDCLLEQKHHVLACGAEKSTAIALISARLV